MFIRLTEEDDSPLIVNVYALDYVETNFEGQAVIVMDETRKIVQESVDQINNLLAEVNY